MTSRPHHRRKSAEVSGVHVDRIVEQDAQHVDIVHAGRFDQRRGSAEIRRFRVRALGEQQANCVKRAGVAGRHLKRRAADLGTGVHVGAGVHQQADFGRVRGAPDQSRGVEAVLGVDVGAGLQ